MTWTHIRVTAIEPEARDAVIQALVAAGGSCVEDGEALVTYADERADLSELDRVLHEATRAADVVMTPGLDLDLRRQWPADVGVQRVGALTVAPPWRAAEAGDPSQAIIIEPAMAFGTGEHPTTRGVLRLMQRVIRSDDLVADLGAGSAVLAIAAAKLGAKRIVAIELDADSIANAEENVRRNGVADRVSIIEGDATVILPLVAPVRVVLANIISSVLRDLSGVMRDALAADGRAILSGMLVTERAAMREALTAAGWQEVEEDVEGDWWSVTVRRR